MRDDILDDINPEDLEPIEEPKWKKPFLIAVGVFLLILILSLSFSDTLMGIIQSKTTTDNALHFTHSTIIFTNNTLAQLRNEFVTNEHREIKACLFGTKENDDYIIDKVEFPEVIRANAIHIVSTPCPIDIIIDLHSHPINRCLASDQDLLYYNRIKASNPDVRMMVMCSTTRFALV